MGKRVDSRFAQGFGFICEFLLFSLTSDGHIWFRFGECDSQCSYAVGYHLLCGFYSTKQIALQGQKRRCFRTVFFCFSERSLSHAGDLALVRQLTEADTADAVVAKIDVFSTLRACHCPAQGAGGKGFFQRYTLHRVPCSSAPARVLFAGPR